MLKTLTNLSVWEISCRTHGIDPASVVESNIPLPIRDTLRAITRAFDYEESFYLLNSTGLENYPFTDESTGKRYEANLVRDEIEKCYSKGIFQKFWLDLAHVDREHYGNWCIKHRFSLPEFWFPNGWPEPEEPVVENHTLSPLETPLTSLRPSQMDKALCQAIAKTLWEIYPGMTIADMCKHPAIQRHGNGRLYQGQHTLRDWLSEVAPEDIKGKRGRPKKSETQQ